MKESAPNDTLSAPTTISPPVRFLSNLVHKTMPNSVIRPNPANGACSVSPGSTFNRTPFMTAFTECSTMSKRRRRTGRAASSTLRSKTWVSSCASGSPPSRPFTIALSKSNATTTGSVVSATSWLPSDSCKNPLLPPFMSDSLCRSNVGSKRMFGTCIFGIPSYSASQSGIVTLSTASGEPMESWLLPCIATGAMPCGTKQICHGKTT
mmetsp:Transcript_23931/g.58067  ORF Transcript_23931/g.58067 Transcript_23931/m.58067 type:complete len:208 (+) Transcript_23931:799-1422(+)